jgi:Cof subfamily protein (haloacid dehalogenase superfamily)
MDRLIAMDLDNTLLTSAKTISPASLEALQMLKADGVIIGLVSGRSMWSLQQDISRWQVEPLVDFLLGSNGGVFCDLKTGEEINRYRLGSNKAKAVLDFYQNVDWVARCIVDGATRYTEHLDEAMRKDSEIYHELPEETDLYAYLRAHDTVDKILLMFDAARLTEMERSAKQIPVEGISSYSSAANLYEFSHKLRNKGTGLQYAAEHFHVPMENVWAFGDATNDLAMIEAAGHGICMANGYETVKQKADDVTRYTNDEDGLARYVQAHMLEAGA